MGITFRIVLATAMFGTVPFVPDPSAAAQPPADRVEHSSALEHAKRLFYSGRYQAAAEVTTEMCSSDADTLPACELRSSALLFQIKTALSEPTNQERAFNQCGVCAQMLTAFLAETEQGQRVARARLASDASDDSALFYLAKLDLNYVWLQSGVLGRRTGWREYWEARRSLDVVLKRDPQNVRARVARAWIDYIVDTKMPRGMRWMLGGGSRMRGLHAMREAARSEADFFDQAEASFALWDMQVRERNLVEAVATAQQLARNFPDNQELVKFIEANQPRLTRP